MRRVLVLEAARPGRAAIRVPIEHVEGREQHIVRELVPLAREAWTDGEQGEARWSQTETG